jgi:hypothetical protein
MVTRTDRVLSRETFPEFEWGTAFQVPWARLPVGFESLRHCLEASVIQMLQDMYVLQKSSEDVGTDLNDIGAIHKMDNRQACIEARLHEGLQIVGQSETVLACILLASYLFCYSLFTSVWNGSSMPQHLSARLLCQLQKLICDDSWKLDGQAVFWCTIIGGSLCPPGPTKEGFVCTLQSIMQAWSSGAPRSWVDVELLLEDFLWSNHRFGSRGLAFWEASVDLPRQS